MELDVKKGPTAIDKEFIRLHNIIRKGYKNDSDKGVRAKWSDGSPAYTYAAFGTVTRYDLSEGFPILSLRKQYWKNAISELLWIWKLNSNNVNDLNSNIWNAWASKSGSIGKAYGYQLGRTYDFSEGHMTQVERLLYLIKNKPGDRRMVVTLWDNADMKDMALVPCAHTITFSVLGNKLNAVLDQRSGDFLAASGPGGFNEIQYAALIHMIAHVSGLQVGDFVHMVANHHIYDRHEEYCSELARTYDVFDDIVPSPTFHINRKVDDFFDFKIEDFELRNYNPIIRPKKKIEIAE